MEVSSTLRCRNEVLGIEMGEVLNSEKFNIYFFKTDSLHKPQKTQVSACHLQPFLSPGVACCILKAIRLKLMTGNCHRCNYTYSMVKFQCNMCYHP